MDDHKGRIMIRDALINQLDHDPHFTWRGTSATRVENLSDIVFALAMGMIASASSDMQTYNDLTNHLLNIIPVAACFTILLLIWNSHFLFFRRYGLADQRVIFLNASLLLIILFFAYPLRFSFDSLFYYILFATGYDTEKILSMGVGFRESGFILGYFAIGYSVIFGILKMMYSHALNKKDVLALSAKEIALTRISIWICWAQIFCALLVVVGVFLIGLNGFAGFFMFLNWPLAYTITKVIKIPNDSDGEIKPADG